MADERDIRNDPTYIARRVNAKGEPIPPAEKPVDDQVLEQVGQKIRVSGTVEGFYEGGAVVRFPVIGGGAIGVATNIQDAKLGSMVTIDAEVVEATREIASVSFFGAGSDFQTAELDRFLATFESKGGRL